MKININVNRKFKINGKEYGSVEEMPDDIQEIFKKTMGTQTGTGHETNTTAVRTKVIFNGMEYDSITAMPQDVRQLYETVLKETAAGAAPSEIDISGISSVMSMGPKATGTAGPGANRKPTRIESSFSLRTLLMAVMVTALILLLYYLFQSR